LYKEIVEMAEVTDVIINKKFNHPDIRILITNTDLNITCTLDDFIAAMIQSMESVTWVFTKTEFERRMIAAKDTVVNSMKAETIPLAKNIPA
jgi:hypothetical protein